MQQNYYGVSELKQNDLKCPRERFLPYLWHQQKHLGVLSPLKEFVKNLKIHVSLMELLFLLSLYHLSWAEKSSDLNINRNLFWQQW